MPGLAAGIAGLYWVPTLGSLKLFRPIFGPWVLYRVETEEPLVALTFDDGPDPRYTGRFLRALENAPSTFFVLGESARAWPDLVRQARRMGHEVACHGFDHSNLLRVPPGSTLAWLKKAREAVAEASGEEPRFFRPPYGLFNAAAWVGAPQLGMRRTLWTAWARDWEARVGPRTIAERLLGAACPGAILLLHDARGRPGAPEITLEAIPLLLRGLLERGLQPVTLSALVGRATRRVRRGSRDPLRFRPGRPLLGQLRETGPGPGRPGCSR